ncbi:MFS monocarboxylate transporter [Paraphaeosphaeria sporulosa]|uniref:MFS monocarboxylate transporter n=1 Tax=Paraphaeosphaeria sporulosa TaxID=1460663 RepID=A0A177CIZ7_9PLEO|nr:MFS monocarboxylate transporter [Paraphaeosphaeria sporulosa]OAG07286.1 MFS monocarboxylate transporter [Paraphaeosphaeria sporulosa]
MDDHELQAINPREVEVDSDPNEQNLPRVDGGKDAYLVLASVFVQGALIWGFVYGFGVFQEYYSRQPQFAGNVSGLAAIGTTGSGIMYLTSPLVYGFFQCYPEWRRTVSLIGFAIMLSGMVGASFANSVAQLLVTQGVLYGLGGSLLFFPVYSYLDDWFVKRRGLAFGVMIAGDGTGGVVIPLITQWMLDRWGFRTAMRAWSIISFLFVSASLIYLKPHPNARNTAAPVSRGFDMRFLRSSAFWILQAGNICQGLGYFMPILYMPSFAAARGWSSITGTIAVSLCNISIVVGATATGWIVDRYHVTTAIMISCVGTMMAVFIFWSFSIYQPMLFIFAITYGVFAGGFPATWSGCANPVRRKYPVENGMIVALFTAGKGIASVISGPVSGALVEADTWKGQVGFAYGSGYGYMIIFSGITASFASIGWIGKRLGVV